MAYEFRVRLKVQIIYHVLNGYVRVYIFEDDLT